MEILEKALAVLENCECKNDPQKDGCYHCLYAYRQSRNIGQVSRITAISLLKKILSGKGTIAEIPKLGAIPVNSLFDSELERRFIGALDRMGNDKRTLEISKILINSKEGYQLKVGECLWEIEPQVILDSHNGVAVKSKPDFILWPINRPATGQKPVAIFTDGFIYHKDKVADDTLKREAIRRCNKFRVWSLSWKDVQSIFQNQGDYATSTLIPEDMPSGRSVYRPTVENGKAQDIHPDKTGTFELLLQYLENPDAERIFGVHANAYAMSLLDMSCSGNEMAFNEWNSTIQYLADAIGAEGFEFELNDTLFGKWIPRKNDSHLSVFSGVAKSDMQAKGSDASITVCALLNDDIDSRTDKYEAEWNGFWQFYNIMQFLSGFAGLSTDGIDKMVYSQIPIVMEETTVEVTGASNEAWSDILEQIFDPSAKEFVEKLIQSDIAPPSSVGYELFDSNGGVVAECEMAWETEKIVFLLDDQLDAKTKFEEIGWTVLQISDPINAVIFKGVA